jgi:mRNA-degrading endonuclease RelE of RelBE toxin-antitoxin system
MGMPLPLRHYRRSPPMSLCNEREQSFPKQPLQKKQDSLDQSLAILKELHRLTQASARYYDSQTGSALASAISLNRQRVVSSMTMSYCAVLMPMPMSLSTRKTYIRPSQSATSDTAKPGDRAQRQADWRIGYSKQVAKIIAKESHGGSTFEPSLVELENELKTNPKQYPKKKGKLAHCRAASLIRFDGVVWRMVFTLDEVTRIVRVLSLGTHDEAY